MNKADAFMTSAELGKLPLILAICAGIFGYLAIKCIMGIGIFEAINEVWLWFRGYAQTSVKAKSDRDARRLARMNKDAKRKTWIYRYNVLMNDVLLDLGWRQMGVSNTGLTTMAIVVSVVLNVIGILFFKNAIMFVLGIICVYCIIMCALYSVSRSQARYRKSILMSAEDLLSASITDGVEKAIKNNMVQFDPMIKPDFEAFLFDRERLSIPIDVCIDRLNDRLGSRFDRWCSLAKTYALDYTDGLEDSFQILIEDNAIESELDEEIQEAVLEMNIDYFGVCGVLVAFFFMNLGMFDNMITFYFAGTGRLLIALYIIALIGGYIYTQYMSGKKLEGRSDS